MDAALTEAGKAMIASRKPTAPKKARLLAIVLLPVGAALLLYSYAPYEVGRDSSTSEARATLSMADRCQPTAYEPLEARPLCGVCDGLRSAEGDAFCADPCSALIGETGTESTHLEIRSCAFVVIGDLPAPPSPDDGFLEPGLENVEDDVSTSAPPNPGPQKLITMIGGLLVSIAGGVSAVIAVRATRRSAR